MKRLLDRINKSIIVTDTEGKIYYCNKKVLNQLNQELSQMKGKNVSCLLDKMALNIDETDKFYAYLTITPNRRQYVQVERIQDEWENHKAYYFFVEQSELNIKLDILNEPGLLVWIKDENGRYCYVNKPFFNEILGSGSYSQLKEIIGKGNEIIENQSIRVLIDNGENEVFTTKQFGYYKIDNEDSNCKDDYEFYMFPIRDSQEDKKIHYIIGIGRDITLENRLEYKIEEQLFDTYIDIEQEVYQNEREDEWNGFQDIEKLKEKIKINLQADIMMFGIFTRNGKASLINCFEAPGISKTIKLNIPVNAEWFHNALEQKGRWGIKETSEYTDLVSKKLTRIATKLYKYLGVYPISYSDKLVGMLAFGYKNKRPSAISCEVQLREISKWFNLLIKNRLLSYAIKEELKKKNEMEVELNHFLDTAIDLTAIIDEHGDIIKIDKRWQSKLGWLPEEVVGRSIKRFIHKKDRRKFEDGYKLGQGITQVSNQIRCKSGNYRWLEWQISYLEDKKIAFCTARDITEKKMQEKEREAYKQKVEIDKIRNEFFGNISHEFRTPINIILASLQLIENKNISAEGISQESLNNYTKKIRKNAFRLLKLSNNLIDLTEMEVGAETLNLENQNIINIVEETTLSVVKYAQYNQIDLIFDTEEVIMACDVEKIQRIVLNLLSNAVKFTPRGGCIKVNILKKRGAIAIVVSDTGIGIPKEKCKVIFDRGVQLDASIRRRCEGSGMGLAIVKSIVDMCKGTIQVASLVGKGTTFTVTLPIHILEGKESRTDIEKTLKVEKCNMEFSDVFHFY